MRRLILLFSHLAALGAGVALGIYLLPILAAPVGPAPSELAQVERRYQGSFDRDRQDSDALHWGEGAIWLDEHQVAFQGAMAPGPAYRLYLSPQFVETEVDFLHLRDEMAYVGEIRSFDAFMLDLPQGVDPADYGTAVIWCEAFDQFISSARYQ
ncbi:DM13 domain-containing protein [Ferrimonas balearica]|uniref:DM13 domain-containing protein n=1 Tax=Ferrimonas balearica TaxID=44012 RepID=UPI001C98EFC2|nr:DM13 domain-containing protein [Ferrimonas balearica]MBY5993110.1 DM13 domain-containing protein [Ferrimonas balearica]